MKTLIAILALMLSGCKLIPHAEHRDPAPIDMVPVIEGVAWDDYQAVDVSLLEMRGPIKVEANGRELNQFEFQHIQQNKTVWFRKRAKMENGIFTRFSDPAVPMGSNYKIYTEVK